MPSRRTAHSQMIATGRHASLSYAAPHGQQEHAVVGTCCIEKHFKVHWRALSVMVLGPSLYSWSLRWLGYSLYAKCYDAGHRVTEEPCANISSFLTQSTDLIHTYTKLNVLDMSRTRSITSYINLQTSLFVLCAHAWMNVGLLHCDSLIAVPDVLLAVNPSAVEKLDIPVMW